MTLPSPEKPVRFGEARARMETGDIVFCRGQYWISHVFERLTHSFYSHAAIAAYWDDKLMLLQAEAFGIQAVPLRATVAKYPGRVDWYRLQPEYRAKLNVDAMLKTAKKHLGDEFGYLQVARAIGYRVFGIGRPKDAKHPHAMFCSEYVSCCFRAGGVTFGDYPDIDTFPETIALSPQVMYLGTIHEDLATKDDAVPVLPLGPAQRPAQPVESVPHGLDAPGLQSVRGGGET